MKVVLQYLSGILCGIIFFSSCQTTKDTFTEPQKDLTGTYKIVSVIRNTVDITEYVDSAGFKADIGK